MHVRFQEERRRLGYPTGSALAADLGVSQSAISKIERGATSPGADVLAAFALAGADLNYVLTGERRVGLIDGTTYGMCEVAVVSAYAAARPGAPVPVAVRSGPVVQVYNRVMLSPRANVDLAAAVREMAELMIASLNDPLDPAHLERNLFRKPVESPAAETVGGSSAQSGGLSVSGTGNRVAGRDFIKIGGKEKK